jgi:hypothetical protein
VKWDLDIFKSQQGWEPNTIISEESWAGKNKPTTEDCNMPNLEHYPN